MFILFYTQTGILHLSLYPIEHSSIMRGIFSVDPLNAEFKSQPEQHIHFFSSKAFSFKIEKSCPDYRTTIRPIFLRKICVFLIFLLNTQRKSKKTICVLSALTLTFLMISIPNGYYTKRSDTTPQFEKWDLQKWIDFFHQSSIASKTDFNKNSYYSGTIPKIKDISEFQVIPFHSHNAAFLAGPFQEITTLQDSKNIFVKKPIQSCTRQNIKIFQIDSKEKIIVIKQSAKITPLFPEEFYLFSQTDFRLDSICPFFQKETDVHE